MSKVTLHEGDVMEVLGGMADESVDSCVTDPPYELGFMGKKWDSSGISYSVDMWREVYRVMKPGAHLLAFGGSRTYHRLACAIEDAGFQIRDQIMWIYGSGFPKSLDVSKGIDKAAGMEREVVGPNRFEGTNGKANLTCYGTVSRPDETAPATPLARQWEGWGTGLKPAHEPIVVARKPLEGTVVQNVLKYGTGAIKVAGCRIGDELVVSNNDMCRSMQQKLKDYGERKYTNGIPGEKAIPSEHYGRWPSNVIHDGSEEVLAEFAKYGEKTSGVLKAGTKRTTGGGYHGGFPEIATHYDTGGDTGSAARFFYAAKASKAERGPGCTHPTVKPLALMAYLVRLVTPPDGIVLDPFMGSGSTLIAAAKEGFDSVGVDKEASYVEMSRKRIAGEMGMLVEIEITKGGTQPMHPGTKAPHRVSRRV